jgi:Catalytic LigB subunit of aromatic ring-opening dioxygenase.
VPILPLMLNTYFPPNVPTPRRCYDVGRKIAAAIEALPAGTRVCLLASGGLTHFATDEEFDRRILRAMRERDTGFLCALPVAGLRSGNSEILNWVMTAGALEALNMAEPEYIPVHRTPAGTGIGLAFATWHP